MAGKDNVGAFPKKRMTAALTGLIFTALGFIAEKLFKSILDTTMSIVAGISVVLVILSFLAFFGAWEKRETIHERRMANMNFQIKELHRDFNLKCQTCEFSHQSLLVGMSANHVNSMQEQRVYYEEYIKAVLWTLDITILKLEQSESSVLPIVNALIEKPQPIIQDNKELEKWIIFLNSIQAKKKQA